MKPIVIYDDKCNVCTAFGSWGRNVIALGYTTKPAKRLMQAQFGKDYGFALMLFTPFEVYWGSAAAAEITRWGYSSVIGRVFNRLIHFIYPCVVSSLNVILRRKLLPHAPKFRNRKLPDNGSITLTAKAGKEFGRIAGLHAKSS